MKGGWTLRELPFITVDNIFGQQPGEGEAEVQGPEDFLSAFCR